MLIAEVEVVRGAGVSMWCIWIASIYDLITRFLSAMEQLPLLLCLLLFRAYKALGLAP